MSESKQVEVMDSSVVFTDYPINKYAKKIDWWTSDKGLELIAGWRQAGCTIKEITEKMGVDVRTFRDWRKKCDKLDEIMEVGRDLAITRVENALYKRAVGFYYDEITKELIEGEMRTTKVVTKYVPPDVKACLHYLYNRDYENWRAIQQPIDVNLPAIHSAEDMLVTIRKAAENNADIVDIEEAVSDSQGQGNATETTGGQTS